MQNRAGPMDGRIATEEGLVEIPQKNHLFYHVGIDMVQMTEVKAMGRALPGPLSDVLDGIDQPRVTVHNAAATKEVQWHALPEPMRRGTGR